jgi:hypothetical protein
MRGCQIEGNGLLHVFLRLGIINFVNDVCDIILGGNQLGRAINLIKPTSLGGHQKLSWLMPLTSNNESQLILFLIARRHQKLCIKIYIIKMKYHLQF